MTKLLHHFRASIALALIIIISITMSNLRILSPLHRYRQNLTAKNEPTVSISSDSANSSAVNPSTSGSLASDSPATDPPASNPPEPDPSEDPPAPTFVPKSNLIISAINPGYTINDIRDSGEFIELRRLTNDQLDLTGYSVRYLNSSSNSTDLVSFADGTLLQGSNLLLGLSRTMEGQVDLSYMTNIAMSAGTVQIVYYGEVVDEVCWGKKPCHSAFKSAKPTSLVRDIDTGEFSHQSEYQPEFDPAKPNLWIPPLPDPPAPEQPDVGESSGSEPSGSDEPASTSICRGVEISEVLSYYAESKSEQFIELHNLTDQAVELSSCAFRYKNKTYALGGIISPDEYRAFYPDKMNPSFSLTKNPNTSNLIELINQNQQVVDFISYQHGQKKATSFALFFDSSGEEIWQQTYSPTPNSVNNYQEFRTCPAGKVINPATGNCVKSTNTVSVATSECPEGKYRNPLTGRCKKIETDDKEPKPCAEGYERNPETNRCRKIAASNEGAGYALVPTTRTDKTTFIAFGIVALLVSCGLLYIIIQFRREIARTARKIRQRLHHVAKDRIARRIPFHRNKKP